MSAALRLRDLTVAYERHPAIHHVSLDVAEGSLTAVVGPNGAGKSTLLKLIAGALKLWRGKVTLDDADVTALGAEDRAERGIVLCPEGRRIFSSLTVEENLRIASRPDGTRPGGRKGPEVALRHGTTPGAVACGRAAGPGRDAAPRAAPAP